MPTFSFPTFLNLFCSSSSLPFSSLPLIFFPSFPIPFHSLLFLFPISFLLYLFSCFPMLNFPFQLPFHVPPYHPSSTWPFPTLSLPFPTISLPFPSHCNSTLPHRWATQALCLQHTGATLTRPTNCWNMALTPLPQTSLGPQRSASLSLGAASKVRLGARRSRGGCQRSCVLFWFLAVCVAKLWLLVYFWLCVSFGCLVLLYCVCLLCLFLIFCFNLL